MTIGNDELKINTIYIISKGRPKCTTARVLQKINYPGEWYIVCGNNDETIDEYRKNFGNEKILVFDWYDEIKHTDTLDNFGFENMPSGACPARNATQKIAKERGEIRCWQLDDDYTCFQRYNAKTGKNKVITDGAVLWRTMYNIAKFGYSISAVNVGFSLSNMECTPANRYKFAKRIFNAHNMPVDGFWKWRGRLNDDVINALDVLHNAKLEFQFKFLSTHTARTQAEKGGLTDLYEDVGTVRKLAYAILIEPNKVKLCQRFGRYHHKIDWNGIYVKIISEKWKK